MIWNELTLDIEKFSQNKEEIAKYNVLYMLDRMQSMFSWDGLPDKVKSKWMELQMMVTGCCYFHPVNGDYWTFTGGLGGEPDPYYQPTIFTVSNPALKYSNNCKIGIDGVLMSNDTMRIGLIPMLTKYAALMADNTITMRIADINMRITDVFSGSDESTVESIKEFLRQIEAGKLGVIQENPFLNDAKLQVGATESKSRLTDLIELEQFLKASMYNELGLQANYNMKRESINSSEAQLGDDALQPLVDNMLKCRQEAAEEINKLFGLNVSVTYNSAWLDNEDEREAAIDDLKGESEDDTSEVEGYLSNSGFDPEV